MRSPTLEERRVKLERRGERRKVSASLRHSRRRLDKAIWSLVRDKVIGIRHGAIEQDEAGMTLQVMYIRKDNSWLWNDIRVPNALSKPEMVRMIATTGKLLLSCS